VDKITLAKLATLRLDPDMRAKHDVEALQLLTQRASSKGWRWAWTTDAHCRTKVVLAAWTAIRRFSSEFSPQLYRHPRQRQPVETHLIKSFAVTRRMQASAV
jgi:hypothetical protein